MRGIPHSGTLSLWPASAQVFCDTFFVADGLGFRKDSGIAEDENLVKGECPNCKGPFSFPERGIGQKVPCPQCGKPVVLRPIIPANISEEKKADSRLFPSLLGCAGVRIIALSPRRDFQSFLFWKLGLDPHGIPANIITGSHHHQSITNFRIGPSRHRDSVYHRLGFSAARADQKPRRFSGSVRCEGGDRHSHNIYSLPFVLLCFKPLRLESYLHFAANVDSVASDLLFAQPLLIVPSYERRIEKTEGPAQIGNGL